MFLKKMSLAGMVIGSALTLLGPAVASAKDRDDYSRNGSYSQNYNNQNYNYDRGNSYIRNDGYQGYEQSFQPYGNDWRERQARLRHEREEHERYERSLRFRSDDRFEGHRY